MKTGKERSPEFDKFDVVVVKLLSVPHDELRRREQKYKASQKRKKRAKDSPASHVSDVSA